MYKCDKHTEKYSKKANGLTSDLKILYNYPALDRCEAEKEVLHNIRKFDLIQFMGLKDKNGTLIYFGDILTDEYNNLLTPVCEIQNEEHILYFKPLQHLDKRIGIGCKSTYSNTLEIIGNIYINSELFIGMQQKDKLVNIVNIIKKIAATQPVKKFEINQYKMY